MESTAARIIAVILVLVLFLTGGLYSFLSFASPEGLSDELARLQEDLGMGAGNSSGASGAGCFIVEVAQAEYEYYQENNLTGGGRYWDAYKEYVGFRYGNSTPWCVCFVWYCAYQCGYLSSEGDGCFGSAWLVDCGSAWNYFETRDRLVESVDYCPSPGDLIMFGKLPGNVYERDHIGIVVEVTDWGGVTIIEGNAGNSLKKNTYSSYKVGTYAFESGGSSYIIGYLRPDYPSTGGGVEEQVYDFLTGEMGLPVAAACGVLANIEKESGFDPMAVGDGGTSFGLCQWHNERCRGLIDYCHEKGLDYKSVEGQMAYLRLELEAGYSAMLNRFLAAENSAGGAYLAGYDWCVTFERPSDMESKAVARGNLASGKYWDRYGG